MTVAKNVQLEKNSFSVVSKDILSERGVILPSAQSACERTQSLALGRQLCSQLSGYVHAVRLLFLVTISFGIGEMTELLDI